MLNVFSSFLANTIAVMSHAIGILSSNLEQSNAAMHCWYLYFLVVGVGTLRVEGLVGPHDRYQVLRVGEVGYGMGAPGDHLHHAHVGAIDDVLVHRVGVAFGVEADPAQLDAGGTGHHQEPLPLRHVPVVALGDARLGHVDGHLASVGRAQELREASALVDVGFQAVGEMPRLVVREERRVELLREAALGEVRHPEGLPRVAEALEQFDYLAERRPLRAGGRSSSGPPRRARTSSPRSGSGAPRRPWRRAWPSPSRLCRGAPAPRTGR